MRRVCLGISAISTFLFASCPENPANAMTLGAPAAMRTAIVDIAVTYRAHCRPSYRRILVTEGIRRQRFELAI